MTALTARPTTAAPARSVVLALARQEAWRLLRQPLVLLGFALWLLIAGQAIVRDDGPRAAFETVDSMVSFFPGVFLILAANLAATRDRRAGSSDLLGPLPGRREERTLALMLASLGPALVALALVVSLHSYFWYDYRYFVTPGFWHIVQGPVTLVGAALLGIMFATWAPAPGVAVIGMVAMVVANAWIAERPDAMLFGPLMTWPKWGVYPDVWADVYPGSPMWHVVYLLGLCGMAAAAAWVRVADRRRTPVLVGLAAVAVAVLGGIGQLP